MKPQYTKPKTRPCLLSLALGLTLLGSASMALADDLLVNTFDADISGIAWENWRTYVSDHDEVWDPAQDADGNANSGSLYVTANWPLASDPKWNKDWND